MIKTLTVKKYNEKRTRDWEKNYKKTLKDVKLGKRHISELPQLAFYLMKSDINYGYVAFTENCAMWAKSKNKAILRIKNRKIYD